MNKSLISFCSLIFFLFQAKAQISFKEGEPAYVARDNDYIERRSSKSHTGNFDKKYYQAFLEYETLKNKNLQKKGDSWTPVGPFGLETLAGIGRINAVEFDPRDTACIYICVAQGGLWKSTNSGASWIFINGNLPVLRSSSLAIHPKNSDTMYVALGDFAYLGHNLKANDNKRNTHYGLGVYKTNDGGKNWKPTGLSFNQTDFEGSLLCKVFIHPVNHRKLVAVGQSGSYVSDDAGDSWQKTDTSLFWDLERSPENPNILLATTGYVSVYNYGKSGIVKSYDFGKTWVKSKVPFKETGEVQRIQLAVAPSDPSRVYALAAEAIKTQGMSMGFYGLYVSNDSGKTFTVKLNNAYKYNLLGYSFNINSGGQGNYDLALLVDKKNKNKIHLGGVNAWTSVDGGSNFLPSTYWALNYYNLSLHADIHEFKQHPDGRIFACHDGGLSSTKAMIGDHPDSLRTGAVISTVWNHYTKNLNITSFYRLAMDHGNSKSVVAGAQDNSTVFLGGGSWSNLSGGDGMDCEFADSNYIYTSSQYGNISKYYYDGTKAEFLNSVQTPNNEPGEWTTPFIADGEAIYVAYGNVYRNEGFGSFEKLSNFQNLPDLNTPATSSALMVSPDKPDTMYVAKRGYGLKQIPSQIWGTSDHGAEWEDISGGLPTDQYPSYITANSKNMKEVWITFSGWDAGKKVYHSKNGGKTWSNITYNLPNLPVNCIAFQNDKNENVYVGTDLGVYYLDKTKNDWVLYAQNLPNVIVTELKVHLKDFKLMASTFGRGIWEVKLLGEPDMVKVFDLKLKPFEFVVSPNPVSEFLELNLSGTMTPYHIKIINISGQSIYEQDLKPENPDSKFLIDASDWLSGEYFIILTNSLYRRAEKFIKL